MDFLLEERKKRVALLLLDDNDDDSFHADPLTSPPSQVYHIMIMTIQIHIPLR